MMGGTKGWPETVKAPGPRRVALASGIGTTIEYYDFFAFGTAAALVFGTQFFSPFSPASATLAALATFGAGFLARPLGGVLWGHLGDRIGRKAMLVSSLVLMGVTTVGVGLLPTYDQIGVAAPIALVVLRLVQGFSVGGEWGAAALMAVEHAPRHRRGRYGSFCQIGTPAGVILAQMVFLGVLSSTNSEQFLAWGWRLPFLASAVLVVFGVFIRLRIEESPEFRELRERGDRAERPLREALTAHPRAVILAAASFLAHVAIGNVYLVYLVSYGTAELGLPRELLLRAVVVGAVAFLLAVPVAGVFSDRVGRRPVYLVGSILLVAWSIPFFALVDSRDPKALMTAVVVIGVALGATSGAQPAMFAEMFPPRVRYSAVSVAYSAGAVLGGGLAPLIASGVQQMTGGSLAVSLYMVSVGIVSLVAVLRIGETRAVLSRTDLKAVPRDQTERPVT